MSEKTNVSLNIGWIGQLLFILILVLAFTYDSSVGLTTNYLMAVLITSLKWFFGIIAIELGIFIAIFMFMRNR